MNWDAVGALGQVVGAFAVVFTLVYLAVQVRQNTRGTRRVATAEATTAFREWGQHITADTSMRRAYLKGLRGLKNLSEDEKALFWGIIFNVFKVAEQLHLQHLDSAMDAGVWAGWEYTLSGILTTTGCQQYYQERRRSFNPRFQEWLDNLVPDAEFRPLGYDLDATADPTDE